LVTLAFFTPLPLVLNLIMKVIGNGYYMGDHTQMIFLYH
jgi:hypothetical protein